jgi:hypothetical protein
MSLSELTRPAPCEAAVTPGDSRELYSEARQFAASLGAVAASGEASSFPDDTMRQLTAALVKIYAAKFDEGQRPALIDADGGVSATAVLVTTSALMKASNLEIFELGMWQSWSGTR